MERTYTVTWDNPSSIQKAARSTIIHRGGRNATVEVKVHDRQGVLSAHGTSTCLLLRSKANPTGEVAS